MTKLYEEDQAEPCFIADGPPSNDLPTPPHRTMNLPQILAGLTDGELARRPGPRRAGGAAQGWMLSAIRRWLVDLPFVLHGTFHGIMITN